MKSTMEEASTIFKAIEQGWKRAGQPEEFSIKVLEYPETNFFGMVTKPAKIAFFFGKETTKNTSQQEVRRDANTQQKQRTQTAPREHTAPQQRHGEQTQHAIKPASLKSEERKDSSSQRREQVRPEPRKVQVREQTNRSHADEQDDAKAALWTEDMVRETQNWIKETIQLMGLPLPTFESDVNRYYLKIKFNSPLIEDQEKERLVFSSFAHLVMQVLRQKHKKSLRGLKVVLNRA